MNFGDDVHEAQKKLEPKSTIEPVSKDPAMLHNGLVAVGEDAPSDGIEALRANLIRKTTLLVQRERDIQILLRQVQEANRWTELSAAIATRIATQSSVHGAVDALASALAEDMSFEFAAVRWKGEYVEVPDLPSAASRERAHTLMNGIDLSASGKSVYADWSGIEPRGLVDGIAALVPHSTDSDEPARLFVGRSARTASYSQSSPEFLMRSLARLSHVIAQAFDAVRLNIELARERDSLQHTVERATRDLRSALDTTEAARAEALRSATARSEFLANMSHEIRTPMTAVLGYADLLDDPTLSAERRSEYVDVLRTSGRHLLQLIDDILDLARIESGRLRFDPQPSSIVNVLQSVLAMLHVRAQDKGLTLSLFQATPVPELAFFDTARLRQILINLVGNALKFTHRGGVTIRTSYSGATLEISVSDTGIGVPADKLAVIFDAFEQSNASTSRQFGGSGLGLAISRRLARLMGGDISVESTVDIGSRFTVTIDARTLDRRTMSLLHEPYAQGMAQAGAPGAAPTESTDSSKAPTSSGRRILLVEDTKVNRVLLQRILVGAGYEVAVATDGFEAITSMDDARASGSTFDLMLLDMHMPNLDGYEAARRLRNDGHRLPIIALTANAMVGDRERCIEAGCTDYLSKPIDKVSLFESLARHIRPPVSDGSSRPGGPS
ncbi:MAG: response regulator [Myxococcales bacterium]|nr:response regulator [Myxococcales bacterium]